MATRRVRPGASTEVTNRLRTPWDHDARATLDVARLLLLVGEPGVGKSTAARHLAEAATGRPPVVLSGPPETEQTHLFGRWTLAGEETRFSDGPLPTALKAGRWLLVEEFSQSPSSAGLP